jgi:hypothetical protein
MLTLQERKQKKRERFFCFEDSNLLELIRALKTFIQLLFINELLKRLIGFILIM